MAWFPPTDFINWGVENSYQKADPNRLFKRILGEVTDLESQLKAISPIYLVKSDSPPLLLIHGDSDKTVPLEANSGEVARRYRQLGGEMQLIIPPGQGHNMWPGFFQSQELVDFVLRTAREPVKESNRH